MASYKFIASEFGKVLHEGEFDSPDDVEEVLLFLTEYFDCRVECVQIQKQTVSKPAPRVSKPKDGESYIGFISWMIVFVLMLGAGVSWIAVNVYHPIDRPIPNERPNPTGNDLLSPQHNR